VSVADRFSSPKTDAHDFPHYPHSMAEASHYSLIPGCGDKIDG
jgi:hypothetical protein